MVGEPDQRSGGGKRGNVPPHAQGKIASIAAPPSERTESRDTTVDTFSGVLSILPGPGFRSRMIRKEFGDCKLFWTKCESPHRALQQNDNSDYCFVNIPLVGPPVTLRGSNEFTVARGGMAFCLAEKGFEIDFPWRTESLFIAVPHERLSSVILDLQNHLVERQNYHPALVDLLTKFCRNMLEVDDLECSHTEERLALALINQLAAAVCHGDREDASQPTWSQQATLQRIKAYILGNLDDPDLCPTSVAEAMGFGTSYLHKLFRSDRYRLMEFVKIQRLERCRNEIAADRSGKSLSQIAFAWGFNDASHFTRCFHRRFEKSPQQYRNEIRKRNEISSKQLP